jgi:hypothetical protein
MSSMPAYSGPGPTPPASTPPPEQPIMILHPPAPAIPWSLVISGLRAIGFLLLVAGSLIVVAFAVPPGSCAPSAMPTCTGFPSQAYNAVLAGRVLWVLGLAAIGGASGIRMNRVWGRSDSVTPGDAAWLSSQRANLVIIVLTIVLLAVLLFSTATP